MRVGGENGAIQVGCLYKVARKDDCAGSTRMAMCTGSSTLRFLLVDHLGSTTITTNSSGVIDSEIRYYPWGTRRYSSGSIPTHFQFTGQRIDGNLGLYYYGARWYDPEAGRFVQADTIVPGGVQGLDRYAYVGNNPLNYIDPSGHGRESTDCGPDGIYCDNSISFEEKYGITFSTGWEDNDRAAVMVAVKAVAVKFSAVTGMNSAFVWGQVYGNINFSMGCSKSDCGDIGGWTLDARHITFSDLDSGYLRAKNNVVHELGHAFNAGYAKNQPSDLLGYTQARNGKFPNRADFPANIDHEWIGPNSGFASGQNQFTWQMSYSNAGSTYEEFADQFLGWIFNTWDMSPTGKIEGQMRLDWMNKYMVSWLP